MQTVLPIRSLHLTGEDAVKLVEQLRRPDTSDQIQKIAVSEIPEGFEAEIEDADFSWLEDNDERNWSF